MPSIPPRAPINFRKLLKQMLFGPKPHIWDTVSSFETVETYLYLHPGSLANPRSNKCRLDGMGLLYFNFKTIKIRCTRVHPRGPGDSYVRYNLKLFESINSMSKYWTVHCNSYRALVVISALTATPTEIAVKTTGVVTRSINADFDSSPCFSDLLDI